MTSPVRSGRSSTLSVIVPVNVGADVEHALALARDLSAYHGPDSIELILVANNFDPGRTDGLDRLSATGATILAIPRLEVKPGEVISFAARIPGARRASSEHLVLLDADCRVPDAHALLTWYGAKLREGVTLAYTPVGHYDLPSGMAVRLNLAVHHASRWIKRTVLRLPTARGSNYAIRRQTLLGAYAAGMLADDFHVGPVVKRLGGRIAYGGDHRLRVLTSGRKFPGSWRSLYRYYGYRLAYNLRNLRVSNRAASRTGRSHDPGRYEYADRESEAGRE
jgi:hypothetical protein